MGCTVGKIGFNCIQTSRIQIYHPFLIAFTQYSQRIFPDAAQIQPDQFAQTHSTVKEQRQYAEITGICLGLIVQARQQIERLFESQKMGKCVTVIREFEVFSRIGFKFLGNVKIITKESTYRSSFTVTSFYHITINSQLIKESVDIIQGN